MKVTRYREDSWMVPGHEAAARRLAKNNGVVEAAFTDLDVGFDANAAWDYVEGIVQALMAHSAVKDAVGGSEVQEHRQHFEERLFIVMLQLATTAVEADRERRG